MRPPGRALGERRWTHAALGRTVWLRRSAVDSVVLGLVAGFVADRVLADPRRFHPVAGFGLLASCVERRVYAADRRRGVLAEAVLVGSTVAAGSAASRLPVGWRVPVIALATWTVLGGRSLEREGLAISRLLTDGDLAAARVRIRNLVGRDPSALDADEIARACVESLAENSADAVVAPLLWGAVAGVPGLLGYRAVNTLDAMWGHRSPRYADFGWAAARLDDVANWLPARLTVGLTAILAGPPGASHVLQVVCRDAPRHPSPNAGPVEAAWAALLGVQLGGTNHYHGVVEDRGRLGDGPPVTVPDIARATRQLRRLAWAALAATVGLRMLIGLGRRA